MPGPLPAPPRSVLSPWQRPLVRIVVLGTILVSGTGLFLLGSAGGTPSFASALFAHVVVGLLLVPVLLAFSIPHAVVQAPRKPLIGLTGAVVLLAALAAAATGVAIVVDPKVGRAHGFVWWAHVAGGLGVLAVYALHRMLGGNPARPSVLATGLASIAVVGGGLLAWDRADPGAVSFFETGSAEAAEAARVHFFPSSVTTGAGDLALTSAEIKDVASCGRCHRAITEEWKRSAHRHASMTNPFYRASIEDLRARFPKTDARWCGGCHDPALLFVKDPSGTGGSKMVAEDLDFDAEDARVGLTCVVCHSAEPRTTNGNADFVLRGRKAYPGENHPDPAVRAAHDVLLKLRPEAHVASLTPDNVRESAFCSLCHKAEPPPELNRWKWIRAQDEYDAHDDSGVSMGNARSFYHPPAAKRCQDCHMPLVADPDDPAADEDGNVRSHLFAAANTALPHLRGDTDMIRKIDAFLKTSCRVDVTAIVLDGNRRFAPAWVAKPAVKPGEIVEAQVVVRNLGVGHRFPGGTVDSNEVWLAFEAAVGDATFYASGRIDPGTHEVDPSAEFYRSFWLRRDGTRFVSRVANDLYTPIYVRRIGPGTADVVRYRFRVPEGASGALRMRATLRYRKFMLPFLENVTNLRKGKDLVIRHRLEDETNLYALGREVEVDLAAMPIVDMATGSLSLPITAEGTPGAPPAPETLKLALPDDRDRLNDLGIAYLLQGDPDRALEVFETVTRVDPKYADGFVNVARALVERLRFDDALVPIGKALALKPGLPKALFFEAEVWRRTARDYPRAEALYRRVIEAFPRDRESWRRLAEVQWQQDRYEDALATLDRFMKIEPEDFDAWFWVMRCYEALGDRERAEAARIAHDRFRRDDEVTARSGETLISDPNLHRLAQPIHTHVQPGLRAGE